MTLPNKRSALWPTRREVTHTVAFVLGAWVALGIREVLSHTWLNAAPPEAQRVAAMAPDWIAHANGEATSGSGAGRITWCGPRIKWRTVEENKAAVDGGEQWRRS